MDLSTVSRRVILAAFGSRFMTRFVTRYGMSLGVGRFVAGEDAETALDSIARLNDDGLLATADHLGESIVEEEPAREAARVYVDLLDMIKDRGVDCNVSLKLTQMGLAIDPDLALENLRMILDKATETGNFVRIDMEDSPLTQITLDLFTLLLKDYGSERVGLVVQAYLYRCEDDVNALADLGANLRLCKGAYAEPESVAFPRKRDVDENFMKLIKLNLSRGCYTAIATHDERIINRSIEFVKEKNIDPGLYEFQMLYGIRPALQRDLAQEGYKVRVYVGYGREWYPFYIRRLAERPANILFMATNFFKR